MNLHHLSVFHAIAETGSITAAARKLHISQPALSRELRMFEERQGVVLFERRPRGMRLTQAGEVLMEHARRLFAIEHAAELALREEAGARRGRLSIGASNTIGTYLLPRIMTQLRKQRPEVQLTLFVGNTEQVSEGVLDLRFMIGFIEGPLHVSGLGATTFQDDVLVPVTASNDPLLHAARLDVADLQHHSLLMREHGSGTRELITTMLDSHGIRAEGDNVMEFGNTEALKQAAVHGGGIAWLPRISMQAELREGSLRELDLPNLCIRRPLKVLHRQGTQASPLVRALLELMTSDLPTRL